VKKLIAFAMIPFACSALAADFGAADWGDTRDEVIAAAGEPVKELELGANHFLVYADVFGAYPAQLWYWLDADGVLVAGVVSPVEATLATFYSWERELSARYGEAAVDDEFAVQDEEVRARASSGYAEAREEDVRNGLYRLRRAWATERTLASLVAKGGAGELTVDAILSSAELGGPLFGGAEAAPPEGEAPPEETP
jgi:hypothetical protein